MNTESTLEVSIERICAAVEVLFLMIAAARTFFTRPSSARAGAPVAERLGDKAMAAGSIFAWLAILFAGRMLPFLGNAF